jgi:MYXO-CTERM domain-containing protein
VRVALAALLAAALFAPLASAHVEDYSQSRALQTGPFLVFFEPRPTPPFANQTATMVVQVSDAQTGSLLREVPATVLVAGPDGFTERKRMEPDGTGYLLASMQLPAAGNYSARVLLRDAQNETHAVDTEFEVFPNLPFRVRPVDQALDVYTGQRTPLAFEVLDPVTLARKDAFTDLTVRIERWSEDHAEFRGASETQAERTAPGVWRIDHTFEQNGMHHLRFASEAGGFNYADVPLLHVYATSPEPAGEADGGKDAPGSGALGALAALAAGALLLLRRR